LKWQSELLGYKFEVWTDHHTLEHFKSQKDLSHQQACWMEFLSQYEATIHYLLGNKNTVANALSQLPNTAIPTIATLLVAPDGTLSNSRFVLKDTLLNKIKLGYASDPFTEKLTIAAPGMHDVRKENEFWFVNN
jgi:reverse transcriptase-like protein